MPGKGSKIFIAGAGNSTVETSCNVDTLFITYKPNGGALASPVGAIHIGIGHDGEQDIVDVAMTPAGSDWTSTYALSNATTEVNFWFHDEAEPPTYDNNGGQNWNVDITECGQPPVDLSWIGNTYHWPPDGEWDPGESLWINIESYPQNAVIDGEVQYSADGGTIWTSAVLTISGTVGNNDKWHANLGPYPGGTTIQYALRLTGRNGDLWDNNSEADYFATVNAGSGTVLWIGNTHHWPENGLIEAENDIWINLESYPIGAGTGGEVVYSTDGGASWQAAALGHNGTIENNDWWNLNLGKFSADTTIRYAVKVVDGDTTEHWDNNGGTNFVAVVNPAPSSLRWFGNTVQGGAHQPMLGLSVDSASNALRLAMQDLSLDAVYSVLHSQDLATWSNMTAVQADGASNILMLASNILDSADGPSFYRLQLDWIPGPAVFEGTEAVINIQTWPIGGAQGANLIYTSDGGETWLGAAMHHTGTSGDNDIWSVSLGTFPLGTVIRYAVELLDDQGQSQWDNNDRQDFQFRVLDPNQSDFEAPATGYSPQNTTTADPTLDVTLMATDDIDPSPAIYVTTNGSMPTLSSAVYSAPIHVTDRGSGVDLTIRFFAADASGNTSTVTTVEVKVNHDFSFGAGKPYSTNPTLGTGGVSGVTIDGANSGEWSADNAVALDMANDDPRSLGDNWTMHEGSLDLTHIWASWDDDYLYLAWQVADVTDKIDPSNAGSAGGGKISNNDGILLWIVLDTIPGSAGCTNDMWQKKNTWAGPDRPDYQIYLAGSLWQGYISRAVDGVFPVDDGGVNYKTVAAAGITVAKGDLCAAGELWGIGDADNRFDGGAPDREFLAEGHSGARDSFYEMRIPLAYIGLTASQLESNGIGVMIGAGSESAMDCIPHDEATLDTPGVETYNSSFEWADADVFTVPFARIGAGK